MWSITQGPFLPYQLQMVNSLVAVTFDIRFKKTTTKNKITPSIHLRILFIISMPTRTHNGSWHPC